jgi:hypothetical protein
MRLWELERMMHIQKQNHDTNFVLLYWTLHYAYGVVIWMLWKYRNNFQVIVCKELDRLGMFENVL